MGGAFHTSQSSYENPSSSDVVGSYSIDMDARCFEGWATGLSFSIKRVESIGKISISLPSLTIPMKFSISLPFVAYAAAVNALTASYDTTYDNRNGSLATVACSDGPNGLLTQGYKTFGDLPSWPSIGGGPAVTGWNDVDCGSCYNLTYTNPKGVAKTISVLIIDVATPDYNIAKGALNELTNNQAEFLGRVKVTAAKVPDSLCGL